MKLVRRAAKIDANQPAIVQALRKAGALWIPIGYPFDGLAGYGRVWTPLEVKDGDKAPSQQKLTDAQQDFFRLAHSYCLPAKIVTSAEEALKAVGAIR